MWGLNVGGNWVIYSILWSWCNICSIGSLICRTRLCEMVNVGVLALFGRLTFFLLERTTLTVGLLFERWYFLSDNPWRWPLTRGSSEIVVLVFVLLLGDGSPELSPESRLLFHGISKFKGVIEDLDFFNFPPWNTLGDLGGFGSWWVTYKLERSRDRWLPALFSRLSFSLLL